MDAKTQKTQPLFSFKYLALYSLAFILLHIPFLVTLHHFPGVSGYSIFLIPFIWEVSLILYFGLLKYPILWLEKLAMFILLPLIFIGFVLAIKEDGDFYQLVIIVGLVYSLIQFVATFVTTLLFVIIRYLRSRPCYPPTFADSQMSNHD